MRKPEREARRKRVEEVLRQSVGTDVTYTMIARRFGMNRSQVHRIAVSIGLRSSESPIED